MAIKILNYSTNPRISLADIVTTTIIVTVETVAMLRNTAPSYDKQVISLLGHTTPGIGGGDFYADLSDTTTADNNGLVIVTTGGKRWKRILVDHINSDMFGGNVEAVIEGATSKYAIKLLSDFTATSVISIRSDSIIDCNGFTFFPATEIGVLSAQGSEGNYVNLTANMPLYTNEIQTSLALSVGDWVFVRSEAQHDDPTGPNDPEDPAPITKYGQIFQITWNPSANTYRTDCLTEYDFNTADTAQVAKLTVVKNVIIRNAKINNANYTTRFIIGLNCVYLVDSIIENPVFIGSKTKYGVDSAGRTALKFRNCVNVQVINPRFRHIAWYGVEIVGACRNIVVHDINGHDCRHTVSFNWVNGYGKPINCHVNGGSADFNTKSGIDFHPNSAKNCTINNVISQGSRQDSGFLIRASGVILNNCQGNDNFFDGLTVRFTNKQVIANNFIARLNNRDGIRALEYGVMLLNPITEDNISAGIYASSAFITGGSSQRNAYAYRIYNNPSDLNNFLINGAYSPASVGRQTVGVFIETGYNAQKVILNNNMLIGYNDFVLSVPDGQGTLYIPQSNKNNKTHMHTVGAETYGTVTFGAGTTTTTIATPAFRHLTAPGGTRGVLTSKVELTILSASPGVSHFVRPKDDGEFDIRSTGTSVVAWQIMGV